MNDLPDAPERVAVVTFEKTSRTMRPGDVLTFGRGADADIRVGQADQAISRLAGRLECREDGVLVHNDSARHGLTLLTFPGPQFALGPGMVVGSAPHSRVAVLLNGAAAYRIFIDVTALRPQAQPLGGDLATTGYERLESITPAERRYLAVLCMRLLTKSGAEAQPLTYAQIATFVTLEGHEVKERTVRNTLERLRSRLADDHQILALADSALDGQRDYRLALALWAIRSGNATLDDLDDL